MEKKKGFTSIIFLILVLFSGFGFSQTPSGAPALRVGANIQWGSGPEVTTALVGANVLLARTGVGWSTVEATFTEPPTYNWAIADDIMSSNRAFGLQTLWDFGGTPVWASSNGQESGTFNSAIAEAHFRKFVDATAERYPDIVYYEFWNEPNLSRFWVGSVDQWFDQVFIPAAEEIRKMNPTAKIGGFALATLASAHIQLEDFYAASVRYNAAPYIDFNDQHSYENSPGDIIADFEEGKCSFDFFGCWFWEYHPIYEIYQNAGLGDKPIWLTEFGWRSDKVGEITQGLSITDLLGRLSRRPRFEVAIIYELQDDASFPEKWGMFRADGSPKPIVEYLKNGYWNPIPVNNSFDYDSSSGKNIFHIRKPLSSH